MSVQSDSNISATEFEKCSKYKDLEIDIAKMWKIKTKTIPVIVGALGMFKKKTQKHVNEIPGNLPLAEIHKIVLNSTAHVLRRTLSLKTNPITFSFYMHFFIIVFLTPIISFLHYIFIQIL